MNTWNLARKQLRKIHWLKNVKRWNIHKLDATPVFKKHGKEADETWKKIVAEPSAMIVAQFLYNSRNSTNVVNSSSSNLRVPISQSDLMAAATC
jgi:adenylate isopentenyltransferase (cytokinin synthase)